MNAEIIKFLKESMQVIKAEFAQVEITPQQFTHFGGDKEYASDELLEGMECSGILWEDEVSYEEIVNNPLFVKAVRWQAAYNTVA